MHPPSLSPLTTHPSLLHHTLLTPSLHSLHSFIPLPHPTLHHHTPLTTHTPHPTLLHPPPPPPSYCSSYTPSPNTPHSFTHTPRLWQTMRSSCYHNPPRTIIILTTHSITHTPHLATDDNDWHAEITSQRRLPERKCHALSLHRRHGNRPRLFGVNVALKLLHHWWGGGGREGGRKEGREGGREKRSEN